MALAHKIYLDFDGVIVDTIHIITNLYNEDFSAYSNFKYINPYEVKTWDFTELSCASADYINTYFNQPRFFKNIKYMDCAMEVIDKLKEDFDIVIVSSGFSPNLRLKAKWIEKHMPYATFVPVNLKYHGNKSHVYMKDGFFFDDSANNLETSNAYKKICFGDTYPWNENWNGLRIYNWKDVGKYFDLCVGENHD